MHARLPQGAAVCPVAAHLHRDGAIFKDTVAQDFFGAGLGLGDAVYMALVADEGARKPGERVPGAAADGVLRLVILSAHGLPQDRDLAITAGNVCLIFH